MPRLTFCCIGFSLTFSLFQFLGGHRTATFYIDGYCCSHAVAKFFYCAFFHSFRHMFSKIGHICQIFYATRIILFRFFSVRRKIFSDHLPPLSKIIITLFDNIVHGTCRQASHKPIIMAKILQFFLDIFFVDC